MAKPWRILFLCQGDAALGLMAAGFARHLGGESVEAECADGSRAEHLVPYVAWAMNEAGIRLPPKKNPPGGGFFRTPSAYIAATIALPNWEQLRRVAPSISRSKS